MKDERGGTKCKVDGCAMRVLYSRGLCWPCYLYAHALVKRRVTTWALLERSGRVDKKLPKVPTSKDHSHALTTARRLWFYGGLKEQMAKITASHVGLVECELCHEPAPSNPCKDCLQNFDDIELSFT